MQHNITANFSNPIHDNISSLVTSREISIKITDKETQILEQMWSLRQLTTRSDSECTI